MTGRIVNGTGSFVMRAERVGADTMLSQVVRMVSEAQRTRALIQRLADQISSQCSSRSFDSQGGSPGGAGQADRLLVDKTGTPTECKPKLVSIFTCAGKDETVLLRLAASLETGSEHPLAQAIPRGAEEKGIRPSDEEDFESITGKGISGNLEGQRILIGNGALLETASIGLTDLDAEADGLRKEGQTVMLVAIDGKAAGLLGVADPIKAAASETILALRIAGMNVAMLTGDNWATAGALARRLGIEEVHAEVLPDQKAAIVSELQARGHKVAMAGDGVNDAPGLAQSDVGIAMGTLQLPGCTQRGRDSLSVHWNYPEPDEGQCPDDLQLGFGHCQRAALTQG